MSDNRRDRDAYDDSKPTTLPAASATEIGPALYGRAFSLVVATASGDALDLSQLRCQFEVTMWQHATVGTCELSITNMTKATKSRMMKEFTRVVVQAGYPGQYGIIFEGSIVQARYGRDSQTDTYCKLLCQDSDAAHNFGATAQTLAAGSTPADMHAALCTSLNPWGVTAGYTAPLPGPAMPRGRVLYGMARDYFRDLAESTGTVWSIQGGKVITVARDGYRPDQAVVLNEQSGLIGMPVQTTGGIIVRSLLNPLLKVHGRIKIDNDSIQEASIGHSVPEQTTPRPAKDKDGLYKILQLSHSGDTRGQPWYTDIVCISADPNAYIPLQQVSQGHV